MKKATLTYEEAMKRIEQIVGDIENGRLDIDHLTPALKEAQQLLSFCKERLTKAEAEVEQLLPTDTYHEQE
ncbi:MAG: exodeoxyribonuclease VII small subunit [Bacteroidaceae bacterium]|nr:exodeoxyribonuclease VII small subunit [Bacteroidaceae bacterium]